MTIAEIFKNCRTLPISQAFFPFLVPLATSPTAVCLQLPQAIGFLSMVGNYDQKARRDGNGRKVSPAEKKSSNEEDRSVPERRRWLKLLLLCMASCVNMMACFNYAAFPNSDEYYGVNLVALIMPCVFFLCFFITAVPSSWYLKSHGLRAGLLVAVWLQAAGCVLRAVPALWPVVTRIEYACALAGQFLAAFAQGFFWHGASAVAWLCFAPHQRRLAQSFALHSNTLGIAAAYLLAASRPTDLPNLMLIMAAAALSVAVAVQCLFAEAASCQPCSLSAIMASSRADQAGGYTRANHTHLALEQVVGGSELHEGDEGCVSPCRSAKRPIAYQQQNDEEKEEEEEYKEEEEGKEDWVSGEEWDSRFGRAARRVELALPGGPAPSSTGQVWARFELTGAEMAGAFKYEGFIHTLVVSGLAQGLLNSLFALLPTMIAPWFGWRRAALLGMLLALSSVLGGICGNSAWLGRAPQVVVASVGLLFSALALAALALWPGAPPTAPDVDSHTAWLGFATFCVGLFLGALPPHMLQVARQCAFPTSAALLRLVMQCGGNACSLLLLLALAWLHLQMRACALLASLCLAASFFYPTFTGQYRRRRVDKARGRARLFLWKRRQAMRRDKSGWQRVRTSPDDSKHSHEGKGEALGIIETADDEAWVEEVSGWIVGAIEEESVQAQQQQGKDSPSKAEVTLEVEEVEVPQSTGQAIAATTSPPANSMLPVLECSVTEEAKEEGEPQAETPSAAARPADWQKTGSKRKLEIAASVARTKKAGRDETLTPTARAGEIGIKPDKSPSVGTATFVGRVLDFPVSASPVGNQAYNPTFDTRLGLETGRPPPQQVRLRNFKSVFNKDSKPSAESRSIIASVTAQCAADPSLTGGRFPLIPGLRVAVSTSRLRGRKKKSGTTLQAENDMHMGHTYHTPRQISPTHIRKRVHICL
eukprot:g42106.t1